MKQDRVAVFIDGSNFYFKLKDLELHDLLHFNFLDFVRHLAGEGKIISCTYYIGKVRTDGSQKSEKMLADQQRLLASLRRQHVAYSLGYLMKSGGGYHEKGVDVNMAVDMLVAVYENLCDQIILVSSDTDLLPAVRKAKEKGKPVEYVGFSHKPSVAMVANCSKSRLITKEDLILFTKEKNK